MKGLILNDLYLIIKNFKAYVFIFAVFAAITLTGNGNIFMVFYMIFFVAVIPTTLFGLDENSRWNVYCCALPCTRKHIVMSKYIIGLASELTAVTASGICYAVGMIRSGGFDPGLFSAVMSAGFLVEVFYISASLPFLFRFGAIKGRVFMMVMVCVVCIVFSGVGIMAANGAEAGIMSEVYTKIQSIWVAPAALAAGLAIYTLSFCISCAIYSKREIS